MYGSDLETATSLRDPFANLGFLDVEPFINSNGQPILPEAEEETFCLSENNNTCFRAGDVRVNENQGRRQLRGQGTGGMGEWDRGQGTGGRGQGAGTREGTGSLREVGKERGDIGHFFCNIV